MTSSPGSARAYRRAVDDPYFLGGPAPASRRGRAPHSVTARRRAHPFADTVFKQVSHAPDNRRDGKGACPSVRARSQHGRTRSPWPGKTDLGHGTRGLGQTRAPATAGCGHPVSHEAGAADPARRVLGVMFAVFLPLSVSFHVLVSESSRTRSPNSRLTPWFADSARVRTVFNSNVDALSAVSGDWANWTDTYDFVGGRNPEYPADNLAVRRLRTSTSTSCAFWMRMASLCYSVATDPTTGENRRA